MQSRRDAIRKMIMMTTGGMVGVHGLEELVGLFERDIRRGVSPFTGNTYEILKKHVLYKQRLFPSNEAFAEAASQMDDTVVVKIRVMNMIHAPLIFYFPNYDPSSSVPAETQLEQAWRTKINQGNVHQHMMGYGVHKEARVARFKELGFNDWFANLLNVGRDEAAGLPDWVLDGEVAPFPEEKDVAIQAALHVNQNDTSLNHSFKNTAMLGNSEGVKGGDINHHLASMGLVSAPFGITCFTMGNTVETTDGKIRQPNQILDGTLTQKFQGESVADFVEVLKRVLGAGFFNESLIGKFDKLLAPDESLRAALQANRAQLTKAMTTLESTAAIESETHDMLELNGANKQAFQNQNPSVSDARWEFLAQCMFVSRAIELPGRPMRNFSLLLNVHDMDTRGLDFTRNEDDTETLTNIEGMRQLALGLNVLAQAIKRHKNVYAVCVTEGGRDTDGADNKVSNAIIMGPGGAGNLKDHLYADKSAISDPNDPVAKDPNKNVVSLRYYPEGELRTEGGIVLNDTYANTASILNGLVKHIEDKQGRSTTLSTLGPYVKLAKKS